MSRFLFIELIVIFILFVGVSIALENSNGKTKDANKGKPKQNLLNVHIFAHTHDDVGWLKTVDEYYYGANQSIQDAGVQYILDTVVDQLLLNPDRKFIYVEIAFFMRWWNEQTLYRQQQVQDLVQTGRLEFINGGWCMNDEANTHYSAIIEQMTEGHQFLFENFGVRPRIGWHIDPFGHAATQASLFAQMGFDAFFFGRIDFEEHSIRNATQQLEFVWRGSNSLGTQTQIWSHVLYTDYCYLNDFAFEWGSDPIQDDPRLFGVNVQQRCDNFAQQVRTRASAYRSNNVPVPFGCDFQYENARMNFKNIDKLIAYINANPDRYGMNVFYSTPSIYTDAVYQADLTWDVVTGDFFPYADGPHAYWAGYFTSRPGVKGYVRGRNNFLHATDKLYITGNYAIADLNQTAYYEQIDVLTQAFSVAQHHDAVAGTEQQHVADDYEKRLYIGTEACEGVLNDLVGNIVSNSQSSTSAPTFEFCPLRNVSICPATQPLSSGSTVAIVAYNHIAWQRNDYLRIPIPISSVNVMDGSGNLLASQVQQNADIEGTFTVIFPISLPPLGFATFIIEPAGKGKGSSHFVKPRESPEDSVIQNEFYTVTFSSATGKLSSITNKLTGITTQVQQDYLWWNASTGNAPDTQPSGAYIFRPNGTTPFAVTDNTPTINVVNGPLVQEVYQVWNEWVSQVVRLYTGINHIEVESNVGPVDISDGLGKEVITRYSTDLNTGQTWYTDSEGQEMQQRRLNYRWWKFNITEPIAMNYYPMNEAAYIEDVTAGNRFTVITDRSRGCSSLANGQFENMIHRRLLHDDYRGVGEPLNETEPIRTLEYVFFDSIVNSSSLQRTKGLWLNNPPVLLFTEIPNAEYWYQNFQSNFTPMVDALPENVHLLNLKTQFDGEVILRLHHLYAVGEDPILSAPATVNLNSMFNDLSPVYVNEMTMTANLPLNELNRLNWQTTDSATAYTPKFVPMQANGDITINPMDTRTFLVRYMQE